MGEPLLCPKCKESTMKWLNPDQKNLIENGIMQCKKCKVKFKGIPGWIKASKINQYKEAKE